MRARLSDGPVQTMPVPPTVSVADAPSDIVPPSTAVVEPVLVAPPVQTGSSGLPGAALTGVVGGALAGAAVVGASQGWSATHHLAPAVEAPSAEGPALGTPAPQLAAAEMRAEPSLHPAFPDFGATKEPVAVETITAKDWSGDEETLSHAVVEAPIDAGEMKADTVGPEAAAIAGPLDLEQELAAALGMPSLSLPPAPAPQPAAEPSPVAEPEAAPEATPEPVVEAEPIVLPKLDLSPSESEPTAAASQPADDIDRTEAVHRGLEELLKAPVKPPQRESGTDALDDEFMARLRDTAFRSPAAPSVAPVADPVIATPPEPVAETAVSPPLAHDPMELDLEAALRAALAEPLPTVTGRPREDRTEERTASERAETERLAEKVISEDMTDEPFADEPAKGWSQPPPEPAEDAAMVKLARDFPELGDLLAPTRTRTADEVLAEPAAPEPPPIAAPLLREGVIANIPFRLYGDGTIEADLAEGATRFASLKDFRAHVGG